MSENNFKQFQTTDRVHADVLNEKVVEPGEDLREGFVTHKAEIASQTQLGHIKIGTGLSIDEDGTLNTQATEQGFTNIEVITSSRTYTVPEGVSKMFVEVIGGGGGGGFADTSGTNWTGGGGGGGGGYAAKIIEVTPGQIIPITVGTGGSATTTNSSNGNSSSFGQYISAEGGYRGFSSHSNMARGGSGGSGLGGDINIDGDGGGAGSARSSDSVSWGGQGGGTFYGGNTISATPISASSQRYQDGSLYGGGGSGGARGGTASITQGGQGADGVVIIHY